jgi:uncharacterized protein
MANVTSDSEIRAILKKVKTIAVIGLSPVAVRPSNGVTRYMIAHGYEIYGVRPASPPLVLGRPCVESLAQLNVDVDMIDVFRNSDALPGLIDELEKWQPGKSKAGKVLWLQEGVTDPESEARAEKLGFKVISDKCILKEHARLL